MSIIEKTIVPNSQLTRESIQNLLQQKLREAQRERDTSDRIPHLQKTEPFVHVYEALLNGMVSSADYFIEKRQWEFIQKNADELADACARQQIPRGVFVCGVVSLVGTMNGILR